MRYGYLGILGVAVAVSVMAGSDALTIHREQMQTADAKPSGIAHKAVAGTPLTKQLITSSVNSPVLVTHAPNDSSRIFIVQQNGQIRIVKNGTLLTRPFLNIASKLVFGGEQGLLGLAFHPNYDSNGYFYVNYTDNSGGDTRISRFSVSGTDADSAVFSSEMNLMEIDQPYANHNGGMIAFGVDGYLYIGMGDGGDADDPQERAQNPLELLGKMLRIDVDNHPTPPPTNPYVGHVDTSQYIWAMGVRNPWRFSFDRETHDLYIADVGQNNYEEVDFQPAAGTGKVNYGWDNREGLHCHEPTIGCITAGMTDPIHEYSHAGGNCSITGGYVYRGCAIPDLEGAYFFGDYCSGKIWSFKYVAGVVTELTERTTELNSSALSVVGFGEDAAGELYICDLGGSVYKIVPDGVPSQCSVNSCCTLRGDANNSGTLNVLDLNFLVAYFFAGGPAPSCFEHGDVNGNSALNIIDLNYFVAYLFAGGPAPAGC